MRLDEAGAALTDQEGFEDTVAAHGGEIIGELARAEATEEKIGLMMAGVRAEGAA